MDLGTPDIRISGGHVEAVGGVNASGIGGGYKGKHGSVTVSGGTVKVTGGEYASDMLAGNMDIGGGGFAVTGGSVCLTRLATVDPNPAPTNALGQRVWCVMVEGLEGSEGSVSLEGLEGYGVKDIVPVDGKVYLWLPNGEHRFVINGRAHYCATVDGANVVATPSIPYRAWNETTRRMEDLWCADCTIVTADTATFQDGKWYAVTGTVSRGTITVNGTAHLILCDGAKLIADGGASEAGVCVVSGNALAVYGQAEGTGALTATGSEKAAGIGGGWGGSCGTVTIDGGTVTATGREFGAGIGGGIGGSGGTVTINGGTVTATGDVGAGIGSGYGNGNDPTGGTITINGGKVTATGVGVGAGVGAGIGGGDWCGSTGNIRITGGMVVASTTVLDGNASQDIGYGNMGQVGSGSIEIVGGSVRAVNDRVEPAPSNGTERVWCVTVEGLEGLVSLEGLGGYGTNDLYPVDGKVYLWLPNGEYRFFVRSAEGVGCYEAVVRDANVTATKVSALPVSPGKPIGPYDTALAATNALGAAVFTPAPAVAEVLTSDGARTDYAANFGFVVTGGDGAWYVSAALTPAAEAKLAASAASVTTNLNLVAIAALPAEGTANLALKGGVLGFYYTLCSATEVRILPDGGAQYGPVLCESADGEVVFPNVKKPSDTAGFFTVRVRESAE